jgi:hypothetical protein
VCNCQLKLSETAIVMSSCTLTLDVCGQGKDESKDSKSRKQGDSEDKVNVAHLDSVKPVWDQGFEMKDLISR